VTIEKPPALIAQINQNPRVRRDWGICIGSGRTKKSGKFMLADRQFITETGKLTTERRKSGIGKCDLSKKKAGGRNHLRVT